MTFTASDVRSVRNRHNISMCDAKRACQMGIDRFDGDFDLGAWWVHANALAINVRGGTEARALWNDRWARRRAADRE